MYALGPLILSFKQERHYSKTTYITYLRQILSQTTSVLKNTLVTINDIGQLIYQYEFLRDDF